MTHEPPVLSLTTLDEIRDTAGKMAKELSEAGSDPAPAGGGSAGRRLPEDLRAGVVAVRAALFRRGVYDPVLVRFDSASTAPATNSEIGRQLGKIAESLRS